MHTQFDILDRMAFDLAMMPSHLSEVIKTAPLRYKLFEIPKKSGGTREVAQLAREVKAIQRWVINTIGLKLPVHDAATAYRSGTSILKNAEAHVASRYMLKLDFTNFFPSIVRSDLCLHLNRYCSDYLDPSAQKLIAHVLCWAPSRQPPLRLCIGAPSSPLISNSIMFDFDSHLAGLAASDGVAYTRYADDITFSSRGRGKVERYRTHVEELLKAMKYPTLSLNDGKTVLASRAGRRIVTGLTLTPRGEVSIGRERKRLIRAMYHRSLSQVLTTKQAERLAGLLAFADSIEPGFSQRLKKSIQPE